MSILCNVLQHLGAGEKLDALVAIHVMGWVKISTQGRHDTTWSRLHLEQHIASPAMKVSEWRPSTNIVQALQVLDACGEGVTQDRSGNVWGTAIRRTGHGHVEITLSEDEMGPGKSVYAATLELGICLAAVAWALRKEIADELQEGHRAPNVPGLPQNQQSIS